MVVMTTSSHAERSGSGSSDARDGLTPIGDSVRSFIAFEPDGGECPRPECHNTSGRVILRGRVPISLPCADHAAEDEARMRAEERARLRERYFARSGMTERLSHLSFETYRRACGDAEGREALALAEKWVADYKAGRGVRSMLLFGPRGTGKTGLAWSIVRSLCEDGFEAKIVNFAHLLEAMKDCYAKKIPTTQAAEANRVPVLVLDDLGVERPTEWACGQLYGIVDHRYERGLPTIYVTNYSPDDLARRLGRDDLVAGQRILSRMTERALKIEFTGKDRRLAA